MSEPAAATFGELRDRLITDGIAEVTDCYKDDGPKREGAIEGFELCRSLSTREEFETVLRARQNRETEMHRAHYEKPEAEREDDVARYWRHRYGTFQVEWVLNCLIVAGWSRPGDMLSGRAAMKVAEVTGSSRSTR